MLGYVSPTEEICQSAFCDSGIWGQAACQAAWDAINAQGGVFNACSTTVGRNYAYSSPLDEIQKHAFCSSEIWGYAACQAAWNQFNMLNLPPGRIPMAAGGAPTCPAEYPVGSVDQYGQVVCRRPPGMENIPVSLPYGQDRVPVEGGAAGYAAGDVAPVGARAGGSKTAAAQALQGELITGIPNWSLLLGGSVLVGAFLAGRRR